ncbi:Uncharacterized protein SCF082_LOCUS38276 [Durusdinium trenchii]|uniref:Uncharacterized protein n=1 Tax=Durusdinium trenchii TaxID=1381693 RepID=A0ABP0PZC5_9DINO
MPGSDELRTAWSLSTLKDGLSFMDGQPHQELLSLKSMSEEAMQRELDASPQHSPCVPPIPPQTPQQVTGKVETTREHDSDVEVVAAPPSSTRSTLVLKGHDSDIEVVDAEPGSTLLSKGHVKEVPGKPTEEPSTEHVSKASRCGPTEPSPLDLPGKPTQQSLDLPELASVIPDIKDSSAPFFRVGEQQISNDALRQRAARIFKLRVNGTCRVNEEIRKEWTGKGRPRRMLEEIFKQCGYDPDWDTFVEEVEIMRAEMKETELVIEGEFVTVQTMEEWGWSEKLVQRRVTSALAF